MKRLVAAVLVFTLVASATAQTTQPAAYATSTKALEVRALAAFDRGEYRTALALFKKVAQRLKDQPDQLGPIEERIRFCERQVVGSFTPEEQAQINQTQEEPTAPGKRRVHIRPSDGQVLELTIRQLGNFDYDVEKGGGIPDDIKSLEGIKLRTRGYMLPLDQADRVTQFALMPSLFACCFGQPPQIQHTIMVSTPRGKALRYYEDEIIIEGILRVEEKKEDGIIIGLFEMDCTSVKPAPK